MRKGFTLVELLIVIIIIGILATMAVPQYQKMVNRAKWAEAISLVDSLKTAENLYYAENSAWSVATIKPGGTKPWFDAYVDTTTITGNRNFNFSASKVPAGLLYAVPTSGAANDDFTTIAAGVPWYCYDTRSNTTSSGGGYPNM
jgi:type IV pilus assembly protein PilA